MEGVLSGLHKSPHQGQSVEFSEHKEYAPGDELRHLDWKAFGKFDRYYVKRYEHETNLKATLVVDASGSMGYRTRPALQARGGDHARRHARVPPGPAAGRGGRERGHPRRGSRRASPRRRRAPTHRARRAGRAPAAAAEPTSHAAADHLAERVRRGQLVIVFSDLFDDRDEALGRILALRARRNDLALFHVLDPAELEFPFDDPDALPLARGRATDRGERPRDPRELPRGVQAPSSSAPARPAPRRTWTTPWSAPTSRSTRCCSASSGGGSGGRRDLRRSPGCSWARWRRSSRSRSTSSTGGSRGHTRSPRSPSCSGASGARPRA